MSILVEDTDNEFRPLTKMSHLGINREPEIRTTKCLILMVKHGRKAGYWLPRYLVVQLKANLVFAVLYHVLTIF